VRKVWLKRLGMGRIEISILRLGGFWGKRGKSHKELWRWEIFKKFNLVEI